MSLKKEKKVSIIKLISIILPIIYIVLGIILVTLYLNSSTFISIWNSVQASDMVSYHNELVKNIIVIWILPLIVAIIGVIAEFIGVKKRKKVLFLVASIILAVFEIYWWIYYIYNPLVCELWIIIIAIVLNTIFNLVSVRNQLKLFGAKKA